MKLHASGMSGPTFADVVLLGVTAAELGLTGWPDYVASVRYRLVPSLW